MVEATTDTRAVVTSLVLGAGKAKQTRAKQAIYVYQDMFRDRLEPVIEAGWQFEKELKGYTDNKQRLAFRNDALTKMLAKEPDDVRADVEAQAKASGKERKDGKKLEEEQSLLTEAEVLLPEAEKARILVGKLRQK